MAKRLQFSIRRLYFGDKRPGLFASEWQHSFRLEVQVFRAFLADRITRRSDAYTLPKRRPRVDKMDGRFVLAQGAGSMDTVKVAIVGMGTVGSGVARLLVTTMAIGLRAMWAVRWHSSAS